MARTPMKLSGRLGLGRRQKMNGSDFCRTGRQWPAIPGL